MESLCPIESIFSTIALIRRGHNKWDRFLDNLKNSLDYLKIASSERVLMSILDTLSDHASPHRYPSIVASSVLREWQFTLSAFSPKDAYGHHFIWPTTMTVAPHSPDTVMNHYERVIAAVSDSKLVLEIFREIIKRIIEHGNCPLVTIGNLIGRCFADEVMAIIDKCLQ